MIHTITTLTDAIRIISDWTESYAEQPTREQIRGATHELVHHVGGYGSDVTDELAETFDLHAALYE